MPDAITQTRHREIAVEHLLFWTIRHLSTHHPDLLDSLEASLDKLGDPTPGNDKDDEAVRHIAAKMIAGARE